MTELKQNQVLSFDDGLLTVKMSGHGGANGWATLSFKEEQFELDADGYQVVEIAPSELRELRDFLNRVIPNEPQAEEVRDAELLDLATAAWESQTSHPWYMDALEAVVTVVRDRLETSSPLSRPESRSEFLDHGYCTCGRHRDNRCSECSRHVSGSGK
jgi:hypothetical protein